MKSIASPVQLPSSAWRTALVIAAAWFQIDVVGEAEARNLLETAELGRRSNQAGFEQLFQLGAVEIDRDGHVAEWQHAEHLTASDRICRQIGRAEVIRVVRERDR